MAKKHVNVKNITKKRTLHISSKHYKMEEQRGQLIIISIVLEKVFIFTQA